MPKKTKKEEINKGWYCPKCDLYNEDKRQICARIGCSGTNPKEKECPFCTQKSLEPIRLDTDCPLILQCLNCGGRVTKELSTEQQKEAWGKPKRKKIN